MANEQQGSTDTSPAAPAAGAGPAAGQEGASKRGDRRTMVGLVVAAKQDKTRRVDVPRLQKHPKYGKYIRRRTVCYVHDEQNESKLGDRVEIVETRPLSKMKRWRLVKILHQGGGDTPAVKDLAGVEGVNQS